MVRLNERVAVVSVDMNTPLKVRVLKRLDDRYTSFGAKRDAFPPKADCLEAVVNVIQNVRVRWLYGTNPCLS